MPGAARLDLVQLPLARRGFLPTAYSADSEADSQTPGGYRAFDALASKPRSATGAGSSVIADHHPTVSLAEEYVCPAPARGVLAALGVRVRSVEVVVHDCNVTVQPDRRGLDLVIRCLRDSEILCQ